MTTYKNIKGIEIKYLSADPPAPNAGQVWYNSTTKVVKGAINGLGAWASGGALNLGRDSSGGAGTQTAGLIFGGVDGPSYRNETEVYNGSSWTEVNNLNTGRQQLAGAGATNTASLAFGGNTGPGEVTELWNGTNWTEVNNLNTSRRELGGSGTSTSAVGFGGANARVQTETWNGTNWTSVGDMAAGRQELGDAGANTSAALAFGGYPPNPSNATEEFNSGPAVATLGSE